MNGDHKPDALKETDFMDRWLFDGSGILKEDLMLCRGILGRHMSSSIGFSD